MYTIMRRHIHLYIFYYKYVIIYIIKYIFGGYSMIGKQSGQIDIFSSMIFEKLIPKDHLLVKINELIDFSFVYDIVKDYYSEVGRESIDPVIMFKLCLLEYLYKMSDPEIVKRTQTDVAYRWFLGLNLDDKVPDDTTISHFRSKRLGDKPFDEFFNAIVKKCIDKDLVKSKRYMIDSTDVAANVNYPSEKKLLCNAYRRMLREIGKYNTRLSIENLNEFEKDIKVENEKSEKVTMQTYCKIAKSHLEEIYVKCYEELSKKEKVYDMFVTVWRIIEQYGESKYTKDKIISCIDPDSRVAFKTNTIRKTGYKDHIIVDEESEIILGSEQTPFNVNDDKKLINLIKKVDKNFNLNPDEISADKAYGTINNRAYLKDNNMKANIAFYDNSSKEYGKYDVSKFNISEDLKSVVCPNKCYTDVVQISEQGKVLTFKFMKDDCRNCPLKNKCFTEGEIKRGVKTRRLKVSIRHDAILRDLSRNQTEEFNTANNKRYKVERRFATLVRNHGLRRCRYLRLEGAKIHITLANIACNIIRMVNLLCDNHQPSFAISKMM